MTKIIALGNCQVQGIVRALRFFMPRAEIKEVVTFIADEAYPTVDRLIEELRTFDVVFMQPGPEGPLANGGLEAVRDHVGDVIEYPAVNFTAYHPDLIYANSATANGVAALMSPIGVYNSAIALFGHKAGLDVGQTMSLFRDDVCERLGYYDFWNPAVESLLGSGKAVGMSLEEDLMNWVRRGCFMHSTNHAKIHVLADISRRLLKKAGLKPAHELVGDYIEDNARGDAIWPVYPDIAERFGFRGGYTFQKPAFALQPGENPYYGLEEFIQGSMNFYKYFKNDELINDRVNGWLADQDLTSFLLSKVR